MKKDPPSLVLSGVNRGNNSAENVLYSGTIGAALEGALQGVTSIALSQYLGPESEKMSNPFNPAIHNGLSVIHKILNKDEHTEGGYKVFYNVNFPPTEIIKGVAVVPQGLRPNTTFGVSPFKTYSGKEFLFIKGGNQHIKVSQNSDVVFPSLHYTEKSGTYTNLERRIHKVQPVNISESEADDDWRILSQLAKRLNSNDFDFVDSNSILCEIVTAVPQYENIIPESIDIKGFIWEPINNIGKYY